MQSAPAAAAAAAAGGDETQEQQQQHQQQQLQCVTGQVTYRRRLSSKLVFYDVLQQSGPAGVVQWWEVVVKAGVFGSVQAVKDLRDSLKLGDVVEVTGWLEGTAQQQHAALQAVSVSITQPWQAAHPSTAFTPQPAPKGPHTSQQQPPAAQEESQPGEGQQQVMLPPPQLGPAQAAADPVRAAPSSPTSTNTPSQPDSAVAGDLRHTRPAASKVTPPQVAVCKFWLNTGRCAKGAGCPYLHALTPAAGAAASRKGWLQQREVERQQRAAEKGFVHNSSAAAKRQRAAVFAAWLVRQYGKDRLNAGAGVLDVAGGSGSLTFELAFVHGIKCTLVDPRPLKLNKLQHKQLQQAACSADVCTLTLQQLQQGDLSAPSCELQHAQHRCEQLQQQQQSPEDDMCGQLQQGAGFAWTVQPEHGEHGSLPADTSQQAEPAQACAAAGPVKLRQVQAWFGPDLWATPGWQQLFSEVSVVVGLHPDQATEPILDFALQQGLSFAVMPCCVFPRLFPHRRVRQQQEGADSVPVVTYEQLVDYMVQRGGAQRQVLEFEGANTCVYRLVP